MEAGIEPYRFAVGGPLRRIEELLGISRGDRLDWLRRAAAAILIAYLPGVALGALWRLWSGEWPDQLTRWAMHARWLGAAPLLFLGEYLVDTRAHHALLYLGSAELLPASQLQAYRRDREWIEQLRDSFSAELILLGIALISALSVIWGVLGVPPARWWSGLLSLTLFRFLLLRWLWRWFLWGAFLRLLSRRQLRLTVLHPDRLGGLGPLADPASAFCAAIAAGAVAMAGGFADRMASEGVSAAVFQRPVAAYLAVTYLMAMSPMWSFTRSLYRARRDGLRYYGALATRYCNAFEQRWLRSSGGMALGSADIQSLADLGSSFEVAAGIQVLPLDRRLAVGVVAAGVVPMLPLVLTEIGFGELVAVALKALL
jgi:hypothetical protein